jgi:thiamine biosynthesis lipoprotein
MGKLLREWSIDTALIHGGGSSVLALGGPPGGGPILQKRRKMGTRTKGWPLTLSSPGNRKRTLARFYLQDRALSGSGLQKGHLFIDPRTAQPVENKRAAWACASTAATADALSTAFMLMSPDEVKSYCLSHSDVQAMIVIKDQGREPQKDEILRYGHWD